MELKTVDEGVEYDALTSPVYLGEYKGKQAASKHMIQVKNLKILLKYRMTIFLRLCDTIWIFFPAGFFITMIFIKCVFNGLIERLQDEILSF